MESSKKWVYTVIVLLAIALIIVIYFYPSKNNQESDPNIRTITFQNNIIIQAETATTSLQQQKGLMYRESLDEDKGMLFIFEDERPRNFWMRNTLISLDIILLDEDKKIVKILTADPCKSEICPTYSSDLPAKYVIEVNAGFTEENEIKTGQYAKFKK
jgi:hypothetical protein